MKSNLLLLSYVQASLFVKTFLILTGAHIQLEKEKREREIRKWKKQSFNSQQNRQIHKHFYFCGYHDIDIEKANDHLGSCVNFWVPKTIKLEMVQKKTTKNTLGHLSCTEMWQYLGLFSLRRKKSHSSDFMNYAQCGDQVESSSRHPFTVSCKETDGWKLSKDKKTHFIQSAVSLWNLLPQDMVMKSNLDGFKRRLDQFLEDRAINTYSSQCLWATSKSHSSMEQWTPESNGGREVCLSLPELVGHCRVQDLGLVPGGLFLHS